MRKSIRAVTGVTAGLLLAAGGASASATAVAPTEIDTKLLHKAVVWVNAGWTANIAITFTSGETKNYTHEFTSYCTGFFISSEAEVATAGHCVEPSRDLEIAAISKFIQANELDIKTPPDKLPWKVTLGTPTMYVGQPNVIDGGPLAGKDDILAQLVDHQPFENGDNALLRLANMKVENYLKLAANKPKEQDTVAAVGFPGSVDALTDVARQPASITSGTVSSLSQTKQGVPVIQINAPVSGGMSGGPTLNQANEVVGINSFGNRNETQSFNFITDTEVMNKFMTSNGVKLTVATASATSTSGPSHLDSLPASSSSSSFPWVLVAGIVVGLLIIGSVAFLVLQNRKKATPEPVPTTPYGASNPEWEAFQRHQAEMKEWEEQQGRHNPATQPLQ